MPRYIRIPLSKIRELERWQQASHKCFNCNTHDSGNDGFVGDKLKHYKKLQQERPVEVPFSTARLCPQQPRSTASQVPTDLEGDLQRWQPGASARAEYTSRYSRHERGFSHECMHPDHTYHAFSDSSTAVLLHTANKEPRNLTAKGSPTALEVSARYHVKK